MVKGLNQDTGKGSFLPLIQDQLDHFGCEMTEAGHIKTDNFQKTSVEGVFACGDNCTPFRSLSQAVAMGNIAGAMANRELILEEF